MIQFHSPLLHELPMACLGPMAAASDAVWRGFDGCLGGEFWRVEVLQKATGSQCGFRKAKSGPFSWIRDFIELSVKICITNASVAISTEFSKCILNALTVVLCINGRFNFIHHVHIHSSSESSYSPRWSWPHRQLKWTNQLLETPIGYEDLLQLTATW